MNEERIMYRTFIENDVTVIMPRTAVINSIMFGEKAVSKTVEVKTFSFTNQLRGHICAACIGVQKPEIGDKYIGYSAIILPCNENGYPTWRKSVRFHQVSTDEVYGSLGAEGYFTEETPLCPHSPYSASKTSADLIVMAYRDTYKMPVTISRCSNNYGPYHFPEKLIPLIIKNILEGKRLPVYGDGTNVRDWLYVEDHCKAIDMIVRNGKDGEIYNVGGHNEKQNIEIVKLTIATIHQIMTEQPEYRSILKKKEMTPDGQISIDWINDSLITFVKDRLGHDQRYAIDPTKITRELGWTPETKFEDGIVKTIRWYLDNQKWVKNVTSGEYQNYYENMYKNR
jgi:dTDP-glucose 4,6-dehydratase